MRGTADPDGTRSGGDRSAGARRAETAPELRTARRLARLLDDAVRVPGTSFSVGLDPVLGLLPGLGDAAATLLGLGVVLLGARAGLSPATLVRMLAVLLIDAAVGSLPVVGDLFDAGFRANRRNVALFERRLGDPAGGRRDGLALLTVAVGAILVTLLALAAVLAGAWLVTLRFLALL
jgi:hypothetical protein